MATQRYRIHFIASFHHTIIADSVEVARQVAQELASTPGSIMLSDVEPKLSWNTIEPLGSDDD
jgi:hypothetical protein